MKNLKLLAIIATLLMVTSIFAVLPAFSGQPALVPLTMFVGTIGQPKNVDPTQAYDTASGELIQNVYDTLLEFGSQGTSIANDTAHKPVLTGNSVNVSTYVAALGVTTDIPGVGSLPEVHSGINGNTTIYGNSTWTFKINEGLVFQPWINATGFTVTGETLNATDVVYAFQRMVVQDSSNSPEWMFFGPAFGASGWAGAPYRFAKGGNGHSLGLINETKAQNLIQNWVYRMQNTTGDYVVFNFTYPAIGMYDVFAQTWSSIVPKDFAVQHGCWNGTFYPGWSNDYRRRPDNSFTPLDEYYAAKSQYTLGAPGDSPAMCGTGPYKFGYWNQATNEWEILAFAGSVLHPWPGPYATPAPTTVIETGVNTWPTRKMEFLAGDFDIAAVNRANMFDLLTSTYSPISGIHLYYSIPTLEVDAIFPTFAMSPGSSYIPKVSFTNGSSNLDDPTLFQDINVRQAFAQTINFTEYISGPWYGEAVHAASWWAIGLTPTTGYDPTVTAWDINEAAVYNLLYTKAGISGFQMTLLYNSGNDQRRIAVQAMENTFNDINAAKGTNYKISITAIDWPTYLVAAETQNLPVFAIGWLADFSDADDFAAPFMQTGNAFTSWQAYSNTTVDAGIAAEEALGNTPADPARITALKTLQYEYAQQAISWPTVQPVGRHWERDWVNGYYVNQLYPGLYYQDLYKKASTPLTTPVQLDITHSITESRLYPWVNNSMVYIYQGQMNIWHGGGLPATMMFTIHVERTDSNASILALPVVVGIYRFNVSGISQCIPNGTITTKEYPNSALILMGITSSQNLTLPWYEDGVSSTLPANATWELGGRMAVGPGSTGVDTNTSLEEINATASPQPLLITAYTTGDPSTQSYFTLVGDINGDAIVDILDAILLANSFGLTLGNPGFNPAADLNGDNTINILDAILLANNFGFSLNFPTLGP
jgi:peptide/nickel transport system substrate-binding protein